MTCSDKLIINAAITGNVLRKSDAPALPTQPGEIIECAKRVRDAGAAILHLHARHADQAPAYAADVYSELVSGVRQATDLIVCVSLSGRFVADLEQRAAALAARPDLASLILGSMNVMYQSNVNPPEAICNLAARIYAAGAIPEMEIFEAGFANFANHLIKKAAIRPPYYFNIILGSLGAAPLDLVGLGHMVSLLPPVATWAVGGIGRYQLDANVMGIAAGGHVRVGLEDNIYYDRGKKEPADNLRLVERIARIGREMGREPATPEEARRIIGLPPR